MNKFTAVAIAIIILCFGGLILWSTNNRRESNIDFGAYDSAKIIEADDNNGNIADHVRGKADSKVIVVEYADLSCPGCASMMPRMSKLYEEYGDRVAFVFRHFPLKGHPNSRSASAAIESAGFQNYYWEMLEALYASRSDWLEATGQERTNIYARIFMDIAPQGDEEKFRSDMNDQRIEKKISFDYGLGRNRDDISATPSVIVNGKAIDVSRDGATFDDIVEDVKKLIEDGLKEPEEKEETEEKKEAKESKE